MDEEAKKYWDENCQTTAKAYIDYFGQSEGDKYMRMEMPMCYKGELSGTYYVNESYFGYGEEVPNDYTSQDQYDQYSSGEIFADEEYWDEICDEYG